MTDMNARTPSPLLRGLLRLPALLYRWRLGWLLGHRFLLLTHTGRVSGRRYDTVLEVVAVRPQAREFVVVAGRGAAADWYRNVLAQPTSEVTVGSHRLPATHRVLDEVEASATLADYERRNRWARPVVRALLGWLVGWRYDGGPQARDRLARELPLVAFRPAVTGAEPR